MTHNVFKRFPRPTFPGLHLPRFTSALLWMHAMKMLSDVGHLVTMTHFFNTTKPFCANHYLSGGTAAAGQRPRPWQHKSNGRGNIKKFMPTTAIDQRFCRLSIIRMAVNSFFIFYKTKGSLPVPLPIAPLSYPA